MQSAVAHLHLPALGFHKMVLWLRHRHRSRREIHVWKRMAGELSEHGRKKKEDGLHAEMCGNGWRAADSALPQVLSLPLNWVSLAAGCLPCLLSKVIADAPLADGVHRQRPAVFLHPQVWLRRAHALQQQQAAAASWSCAAAGTGVWHAQCSSMAPMSKCAGMRQRPSQSKPKRHPAAQAPATPTCCVSGARTPAVTRTSCARQREAASERGVSRKRCRPEQLASPASCPTSPPPNHP